MKVTKKLMDKIVKMADTVHEHDSWPRGERITQRVMPQAIRIDWPQNWDLGYRKIEVHFLALIWDSSPGGGSTIRIILASQAVPIPDMPTKRTIESGDVGDWEQWMIEETVDLAKQIHMATKLPTYVPKSISSLDSGYFWKSYKGRLNLKVEHVD